MVALGSLVTVLGLDASPQARGLLAANTNLRSFRSKTNQALAGVDRRFERSTRRVQRFSQSIFSLRGLVAGAGALSFGVLIRESIQLADSFSLVESRLRLVTGGAQNLIATQARLFQTAQDTRIEFSTVAEVYARLARASDRLDFSQQRLLNVNESINQAIVVSGANATEATAGLIQFSQGISSGTLRGEELRSVLEQLPRLARAIADGLGVTVGRLREIGAEGELTAEKVLTAIETQGPAIRKEFEQIDVTVSQALTNIGNAFGSLVDRINDSTGAQSALSSFLQSISDVVTSVGERLFPNEQESLEQQLQRLRSDRPVFANRGGFVGPSRADRAERIRAIQQELLGIEKRAQFEEMVLALTRSTNVQKNKGVEIEARSGAQAGRFLEALKEQDKLVARIEKRAGGARGRVDRQLRELLSAQSRLDPETFNKEFKRLQLERIEILNAETDAASELAKKYAEVDRESARAAEIGQSIGQAVGSSLADAVVEGEKFEDTIKNIGKALARLAAQVLIQKPIEEAFGSLGSLIGDAFVSSPTTSNSQGAPGRPSTATPQQVAGGGQIRGPGGPREDRIFALLSNGEFVVNARQARRFMPLLEAINDGDVRGFQAGGAVGSVPRSGGVGGFQVAIINPPQQPQVREGVDAQGNKRLEVIFDELLQGAAARGSRGFRAFAQGLNARPRTARA